MSEEKANKARREEELKEQQEVALKIQEILESSGYALQPFLNPQEFQYGIVPRVRLVKVPKPETNATNDQGENPGDTQVPENTDTDTKPESA